MLKVFDVAGRAPREGGETVLGLKDLGTHACYLLYGVVSPDDEPRTLKPGEGHEEIILCVGGALELTHQGERLSLQPGQAVYLQGEQTCQAVCAGPLEARYVAAGGHSPGQEHHH